MWRAQSWTDYRKVRKLKIKTINRRIREKNNLASSIYEWLNEAEVIDNQEVTWKKWANSWILD